MQKMYWKNLKHKNVFLLNTVIKSVSGETSLISELIVIS